jgi:hypothetical protein
VLLQNIHLTIEWTGGPLEKKVRAWDALVEELQRLLDVLSWVCNKMVTG